MISRWAPQLAAASPLPAETPKLADRQIPPAVQVAAADGALSQWPPPAQPAPQDAAAAPIPPELTELLQTMARDSRKRAARDRAAQDQPGRTGPRECEDRRATQGEPGANGPARSPTAPSGTCGAGHPRHRHRRLPPLRVDPCRRFRRRKRERKRARQCHCGPNNSSCHRRRRRPVQHASASLKIFVRHPKRTYSTLSANSGVGHWILNRIASSRDVRSGELFEASGGQLLHEMIKLITC